MDIKYTERGNIKQTIYKMLPSTSTKLILLTKIIFNEAEWILLLLLQDKRNLFNSL